MKKFNIAFIPDNSYKFIALANKFKKISNNYCLGEKSIPHITICQFLYNPAKIRGLWEKIISSIEDKYLTLSFEEISHISFDSKIYWVSLIPKQKDELFNVFYKIIQYVEPIRNDSYDPHLTLFNYAIDLSSTEEFFKEPIFEKEDFKIALGEWDGQVQNLL